MFRGKETKADFFIFVSASTKLNLFWISALALPKPNFLNMIFAFFERKLNFDHV